MGRALGGPMLEGGTSQSVQWSAWIMLYVVVKYFWPLAREQSALEAINFIVFVH